MSNKFDYLLKYIIVGDASVGKSNLLIRFTYNTFQEDYQMTIGVEFGEKNIEKNNKIYRIQIWDTAGQEEFRSITRSYYKNAVCALVVYDISNRKSFENTKQWIMDCKNYMAQKVTIILVGNKCDLEEQRKISKEEGQELADAYGLLFFETSAKTDVNVNTVFNTSLEEIARRIDENYYDLNDETCGIKKWVNLKTQSFITVSTVGKKKKSCC